jgi:hypothetical protein
MNRKTFSTVAGAIFTLVTVKRAMIFNPDTAPGHGSYYLSSFKTAARWQDVLSVICGYGKAMAKSQSPINH